MGLPRVGCEDLASAMGEELEGDGSWGRIEGERRCWWVARDLLLGW